MNSLNKEIRAKSGFTLLEMMIAVTILGAVFVIAFQIIGTSQRAYSTGTVQSDLEDRGNRLVDKLQDGLTYAKVISITNSHTVLTFRQPIDANGDGTIFDALGAVEWGVDFGGIPRLNWSYEYYFSTDPQVGYRTVSEAVTGIDYNGDGALNAQFAISKIMYRIKDTLGAVQFETDVDNDVILRINAPIMDLQISNGAAVGGNFFNFGGGGTTGDPLFVQLDTTGVEVPTNPAAVFINIWHGKFDPSDSRRFYMKRCYNIVRLRNPQT